MIVFTGLSGSGKSSLAFDTIFAEGQRRYVESLSSYARQFLGQMDKPDVDFIEGLSPAVSIDQKSTSRNPRSTVGTITEVYDYLRLLFARVGEPHCPVCGERDLPADARSRSSTGCWRWPEGTRFQVLAPVVRGRKGEYVDLFAELQAKGYARARVDGVVHPLTEPPKLKKQEKHTIEVVVDRLSGQGQRQAAADRLGRDRARARRRHGAARLRRPARGRPGTGSAASPSTWPAPTTTRWRSRTWSRGSFSFNAPYGACPECTGLGTKKEVDPELVVPDPERTLREGAIQPWAGGHNAGVLPAPAGGARRGRAASTSTPRGARCRRGRRRRSCTAPTTRCTCATATSTVGSGPTTPASRAWCSGSSGGTPTPSRSGRGTKYEGYMRDVPCAACGGARLKPEVLAVTLAGRSIAEVCSLSVGECAELLAAHRR